MNTNTTSPAVARIATVRSIGSGIRKLDTVAADIVAALPDTFDPKARGAVAAFVSTWINGDADAPAQKTGPKGDQTLTDYGRGFAAIVTAVKRALSDPPAKTERVVVTYVDADGASHTATVDADTDLYAALVALTVGE